MDFLNLNRFGIIIDVLSKVLLGFDIARERKKKTTNTHIMFVYLYNYSF